MNIDPTNPQIIHIKISARLPNEVEPEGTLTMTVGDEHCSNNEVGWGAFDEDGLNVTLKEVSQLLQGHLSQASYRC